MLMLTFEIGDYLLLEGWIMENKDSLIFTLVCSLLVFVVSMNRILTESLSSTPLFAAFSLAIGGLIGVVGVVIKILRKSQSN